MLKTIPTMLTINETAARTGLAKHFIRQLVTNNKVVHVKAGTKYLLNFERFVDYLNNGEMSEAATEQTGNIRRLYG